MAEQPVTQREPFLLDDLGAGAGVQLHDPHAGRADIVADSASGAVIHRLVGRRLAILAEALRLRADILRAGE
jgi:hypothetical protein